MTARIPRVEEGPFYLAMRSAERRIYREALEAADGDLREAAALLKVSKKQVTQRARIAPHRNKQDHEILHGTCQNSITGTSDPPDPVGEFATPVRLMSVA